jgi:putative ATP-dependent endonuclease of the OLD family
MKLVSVTVKNFRSITDAYKIPVGDLAVLVGPNNEGKSNVLKAIVLALALIAKPRVAMSGTRVRFRAATDDLLAYDWQRDFPVSLQQVRADGRSEIVLEFSMSTPEANAFRQATGLNLNKNLKLAVLPGIDDNVVELKLQGQAKSKMTPDQFVAITKFVAGRINIQYIPTVRSSETTESIVADLMASELRRLEDKPEYLKLLEDLESAQRPLLEQLGVELTATVRTFIPEVRQISIVPAVRRAVSRSATIQVDDGADTLLALKGDGVKSLAAMSLMRHVSQKSAKGRSMIFAVEEPESHLHPDAIHRLRQVLLDISQDNQVVLTTHSPSLVDRVNPSCNVIVRAGKAVAATSLRDVRDALGVRLSDNLSSARLALLVEGESDRRILARLLGDLHADLKRMIDSGELVLDVLRGASNLRSKLGFHRAHICQTHTFLDNDDEGRLALKEAQDSDLVPDSEYHVATAKGMKNSELEDLLKPSSYRVVIETELRVTLDESALSATNRKWGERMKDQLVASNGKVWTPKLEQRVKTIVADQVQAIGLEALHPTRKSVVVQLAETIKARLMVN